MLDKKIQEFADFCKYQHDVVCNQKYNETLPYSFHLEMVANQAIKFKNLLSVKDFDIALCGAYGHDLIEDARLTYNNIKNKNIVTSYYDNICEEVAEVIYCCTELRGKNRAERHGADYVHQLRHNRLALFVKLCDMAANITFSLMTNNSMYQKYQKEFIKFKELTYRSEFEPLYSYINQLLTIKF